MKASLKFREEQRKPLFKAKVPLNILGLPFQSSLAAGDSKELCLNLGTFFETGPAFRVAYRPNDPSNPFSLLVKTGIGHFGSPIDAPLTMSAEFDFSGGNSISNPKFFLHFKPQFGDFSLKKSHQSAISVFSGEPKLNGHKNGVVLGHDDEDGSLEVIEKPPAGEFYSGVNGGKMTVLPLRSSVEEAVAGVEMGAKTVLPIRNGAVMKLRWGMKLPEGLENVFANPRARIWPRGIPQLKLNKIGIEHVARDDRRKDEVGKVVVGPPQQQGGADVAEACFGLKRQMEMVRAENALLGKALEDLRVEFGNTSRGRGRGLGERKSGERESEGNNHNGGIGIEDMKKA